MPGTLESTLANIPGYGGYLAKQRFNQEREMGDLQQASGALGILGKIQAAETDRATKQALSESGGDVEKAMQTLISKGNLAGAHSLAPVYKVQQEKRMQEDTMRGMRELNAPPGGGGDEDESTPIGKQKKIDRLRSMQTVYARNPAVVARIQSDIERLEKTELPKTRTVQRGDEVVTEEVQPNGTFKEIGRGPKFSRAEGKPPAGYRWDPTGNLQVIPGGPADKPIEKALPGPAAKAILENQQNLRRAEQALELAKGGKVGDAAGDEAATGWKGFLPDTALQRVDPKGVDTRAAIADLGSLVIHDRSGAAVTAAEFPRLKPFIPTFTDDAETVKKKLARFVSVYQTIVGEQTDFYRESGYKVPSETLRPGVPAAPAPAPGKPPRLKFDAQGNPVK